jgi:hypothetical protein
MWPQTVEGRRARITQYKDMGIFVGAMMFIYLFEDKIRGLLEIDTEELRVLTAGQRGAFPM